MLLDNISLDTEYDLLLNNIQGEPMKKKLPKDEESVVLERIKHAALTGEYTILRHSRIRCKERDVSAMDIELVLEKGRRFKARDRFDEDLGRWSYALEGKCIDASPLRVIVTLLEIKGLGIVTVVIIGDRNEK